MIVLLASATAVLAGLIGTVLVVRVAVARAGRRYESELAVARHEAEHDGLTGALVRAAFARELGTRIAVADHAHPLALLAIDVDGFGQINKLRGHASGDLLLIQLVRTVARVVRHEDVVGRLGGDEFAVLVRGEDPRGVAQRILDALREPDAGAERLDVSIGIASAPADGATGAALLRAADVAMRGAKRAGKGRIVAYAGETLADRDEQEARRALAAAIERGGIAMAVQPIVDLRSGEIHAYEALARFTLPGDLSTGEAFALAERVGMREQLDLACFERALALLGQRPRGTRLAINVAGALLSQQQALGLLAALPDEQARDVVLEVTEDALVRDYAALRQAVGPLLDRGMRLAVDDMGAGYAGLRHAIDLHPAYLKLDRALVHGIDRDPKRAALVDALLRYAEHAGSHIVAEGVETDGELAVLRRLGVPFAQGYLLARPAAPWPSLAIEVAPDDDAGAAAGAPAAALAGEREVAAVAPGATAEQAHARFTAEPLLEGLVVLDDDRRVLGLVTRRRLLTRLGHRFGFALYGQRPLLSVADRQCLALSEATPWRELAARAMARPPDTRHDPILLLDPAGRFSRHLTIRALLERAAGGERVPVAAPIAPPPPARVASQPRS
ncbi:EAL domain-containing protein [Conexibacter stalactiti]|uniref:EAL domain-containing protein n=1 Tax=Conexibacter stalactiti TaxID=1940611 RepID=A0ABU4HJJ6_9ACTN|nr:EAL domain-containing protein [Conexibacter stalactiti]MDW5593493.1 EAL domain-containing protein [Conexibacter stalactiti]MEC5034134.1 EAL domain-containing protein [Conexibacter stalactiti]